VAGYESGAIALFDMTTYKLVKIFNEIHTSEVLGVKIYQVVEGKKTYISILSLELEG
jgi:hypothetical protein